VCEIRPAQLHLKTPTAESDNNIVSSSIPCKSLIPNDIPAEIVKLRLHYPIWGGGGAKPGRQLRLSTPPRMLYAHAMAKRVKRSRSKPLKWTPRAEKRLKEWYGLTAKEYDRKLAAQGGRCAACRELPKRRRLGVALDDEGKLAHLYCPKCQRRWAKRPPGATGMTLVWVPDFFYRPLDPNI
jgi:hypothetical protein